MNLLRLGELTTQSRYYDAAILGFSAFQEAIERNPRGFGEMLLALDFLHDEPKEIVIVRSEKDDAEALLAPLRRSFVPNRVLAVVKPPNTLAAMIPLVEGKRAIEDHATAYVCENGVCGYPTSDANVFAKQISKVELPSPDARPDSQPRPGVPIK